MGVSQPFFIKDYEEIFVTCSWSCLCHGVTEECENKGGIQGFSPIYLFVHLWIQGCVSSGLCGIIQKGKVCRHFTELLWMSIAAFRDHAIPTHLSIQRVCHFPMVSAFP